MENVSQFPVTGMDMTMKPVCISLPLTRMISIVPSRGPTLPCSTKCSFSSVPYCVWFSLGEWTSFLPLVRISYRNAPLTTEVFMVINILFTDLNAKSGP